MIVFLTLCFAALVFVLIKTKTLPDNALVRASPFGFAILLLVFLFIPMQWGAPTGSAIILRHSVQIVSNVAGQVTDVPVTPNAPLKKGGVLFRIDPTQYKMMKSLYDPADTPNLRDDILKLGRGARTVVELKCLSRDAQLLIREMIEDTPSLTAFSTTKSALYKDGLFFCVYVEGEITPEIRSRATLIL